MVWTNLPEIEEYLPKTVDPGGMTSICWNQIKMCIKKDTADLKYHSLLILLTKIRSTDIAHNLQDFLEESCKLEDILVRLEDLLFPVIFLLYERFKFIHRARGSEETVTDYLCALDGLAETCEFSDVKEIRIKEQLLLQGALHPSLKQATESCSLSELKELLASCSENELNHYKDEKLLNCQKYTRHRLRKCVEQSFKNKPSKTEKDCDQPYRRSNQTALLSVTHRERKVVKARLKGRNRPNKTSSSSSIVKDKNKNSKRKDHASLFKDNSTENKIVVPDCMPSLKPLASAETEDGRNDESLITNIADSVKCLDTVGENQHDQKKGRLSPAPSDEAMDVGVELIETGRKEFKENINCPTDVKIQDNELFSCQTCNETFPTNTLEMHRSVCPEFDREFDSPARTSKHMSKEIEGRYHSKPSANKLKRRRHHEDYTCVECGAKIHGKRSFNKHMNHHNLYCNICNRVLDCRYTYKLHMDGHRGNKPYNCVKCSRSFTRKSDLKAHTDIHNPDRKKNHVCNLCGKDFYRIHELNRHKQLHTEDKLHVCDVCKKGFPTAYGLKCHCILHTGVKSFSCDKCGKLFAQKSNLVMHLVRHTDIREHECSTCGRKFARKYYLESHSQTHSKTKPYTCEICGACVSSRYSLQRHKLIHSGLKPHVCQLCGQSFTWQSTYKKHMESHGNQDIV